VDKNLIRAATHAAKTINQENALKPELAAKYIGVSEATLRLWRSHGEGPPYFRAGEKLIRYRRVDLDAWIESRLNKPSDAAVSDQTIPATG